MNSSPTTALLKNVDATLNRTKILFNATLTDGTNEFLDRVNYTGNPEHFYWQNDKGVPVYIYDYRFCYEQNVEPTAEQLYHSGAWDSKIGLVNDDDTDYEPPYIDIKNNKYMFYNYSTNAGKQQWVSNQHSNFEYHFDKAPIEIGVSRKFGHYIAGNLTSGYNSDPIGIIEGYYYA